MFRIIYGVLGRGVGRLLSILSRRMLRRVLDRGCAFRTIVCPFLSVLLFGLFSFGGGFPSFEFSIGENAASMSNLFFHVLSFSFYVLVWFGPFIIMDSKF